MDWMWVLLVAVRALSPAPDDRWATTLNGLDRVRAEAFATADPSRLGDVYAPGSTGERRDAAVIASYEQRGGRVVGAELRIIDCRVVRSTDQQAQLEVVDRLGPAHVVWDDGTTTDLPRDRASRRLVVLRRTDEGWRIAGSRLR